MAAINDLINQITDVELRERIQMEVNKLSKQKKFGLVFEEHLPECTPLYDIPIKKGCKVILRDSKEDKSVYTVWNVEGDTAVCVKRETPDEPITFAMNDIVRVAEFGESIYPYLKPIDSVCNAPNSDLWHTLIEADNYHALQLLEYLYVRKVDCIYIDPPYNTGARDWKYNNDYVDGADTYRHSKWLSMMQKRLKIAKRLLNPKDSVLIITIDEKEYLHLGCLLEELFPKARIQMISALTNSRGVARDNGFARVDEYIFVLQFGESSVCRLPLSDEWRVNVNEDKRVTHLRWSMLIRSGSHFLRSDSVNQFYPIFVTIDGKRIYSVGEPYYGENRNEVRAPQGTFAVWPLRKDGKEGNWQISNENLRGLITKGYVMLGRLSNGTVPIYYLKRGEIEKVENGIYEISGYREDGSIISDTEVRSLVTGTQWRIGSHDASIGGTGLLKNMFGDSRFSFPKSLYSTHDTIRFFVANKPDALILDFFAGSGTTLHAVNLLNAEDGGHRRCIIVTNNEVSEMERKELMKNGYRPGDEEWERIGIARYVTWPRTVCSINGVDIKGNPLKGSYLGLDVPMSQGFKANANFFKLGFLDKTAIALGMKLKEMLPVLWMKAGAVGRCPEGECDISDILIFPENKFAVLVNENAYAEFKERMAGYPEIQTVFINTDYEANYRAMVKDLNVSKTYQLYREYIDNFRINHGRN